MACIVYLACCELAAGPATGLAHADKPIRATPSMNMRMMYFIGRSEA